jgi:hypothetical protein
MPGGEAVNDDKKRRAPAVIVVRWSAYVGKGNDVTDTMALTATEWRLVQRAVRESKPVLIEELDYEFMLLEQDFKTLTTDTDRATVVRDVIGRSVGDVDLLYCVRRAYGLEQ